MSETATQISTGPTEETAIVAALGTRPIVLVGMMGAGKSTVGRRLAARLRLPFLDADIEIEAAHAGMTIPEIFATHGEPYFRDGEVRVIARLLESGPNVLATGGGAVMREETRQRIRDKAVSILTDGVPGSPMVKRVATRVATGDFTPHFFMRLMAKDIGYAIKEAKERGIALPTAAAALSVFQHAIEIGRGEEDFTAVVKTVAR